MHKKLCAKRAGLTFYIKYDSIKKDPEGVILNLKIENSEGGKTWENQEVQHRW